jgi:hypothetical protein
MSILVLLLVLLLVAGVFGGYGHSRGDWGYVGWSPLVVILVILLVFYAMGLL